LPEGVVGKIGKILEPYVMELNPVALEWLLDLHAVIEYVYFGWFFGRVPAVLRGIFESR
jgi:hypothetical protein